MDEQLIALYHRHVAAGFDRQLRMADFLERKGADGEWNYDLPTASLAFGKVTFEAPVLGSHADHNNSWLWAWSNKNLKLTITNRALGDTVRMLVHRLGVHALAGPGFSLEPLLGVELTEHAAHVLGIVLASELGYDAYYTVPYEGGRAAVLVRDERLKVEERHPLRRVLTVFPQVIAALPVYDHKAALAEYAKTYGLSVTEEPHAVTVAEGRNSLTATFDVHNRLATLDATISPEEPKPKKKPVPKPKPAAKPAAKKKPAAKPARSAAKKIARPVKKAIAKAKPKVAAKATAKQPAAMKPVAKKPAKPAKKPGKKR